MAWCLFLRYKALNAITCFLVKTAAGVEDRNANDQNTWQSQWQTCFKCCLSARWVMAIMVLKLPKTVIGVVSSNEPECSHVERDERMFWEEEKTPENSWQHGRARRAKRVKTLYLSSLVVVGCGGQGGVGDAERGMSLERQNRAAHEGVHVPAKELRCFYSRQWKINNMRCLYLITLVKSLLWLLSDKAWMQRNNETIILHRRTESW